MYESLLALAIKNNGKILKEDKDTVLLPFGSEYSIFIKNMNTRRALVTITIDGTNVCSGGIVVNAGASADIERFVKDHDTGNRFKFIEKTQTIENARGNKIDDGLIRVEFQFEKEVPQMLPVYQHEYFPSPIRWTSNTQSTDNNPLRSISTNSVTATSMHVDVPTISDSGITVPGSISNQKFVTVSDFPLDDKKHVIVMRLLGVDANAEPIKEPTPARRKQKCVTCAKINKATAKFCTECGTSLTII